MAPRFGGSPRVELVREPVSRGWGESYAVRLLDPAGRPMAGADLVLGARMEDRTVENISKGAPPGTGTYLRSGADARAATFGRSVRLDWCGQGGQVTTRTQ